ncbi:hypothetical protein KSS87_022107 [Heliosperma pusillum]|nr:hypothetical protein KSS87_022107 [Heliosperma pusillum]
MWLEVVLGGALLYIIFRLFFSDDDILDVESSDFNAIFSVASRFVFLHSSNSNNYSFRLNHLFFFINGILIKGIQTIETE